MQVYSPISIGNKSLTFHHLKIGSAIGIARLAEKKHEQKITAFLKAILNDSELPYHLYAQQRHYLVMKYQQLQQESFNFNIDFEKYEKNGDWCEKVEIDGYVFRQLNGFECEALELYAHENTNDYIDWMFGAISLQVSNNEIPFLEPTKDINFAKRIIENRINIIKNLDLEKTERLLSNFLEANERLNNLVEIGFDSEGIVCVQQGGTDDAPIRFRPLSTIPESIKNLLGGLSSKS